MCQQQGDNIDAKTDAGWKETLAKISEAHPDSELTKQYGKRKSTKAVKTEQVRKKHKTIAERRIKRIHETSIGKDINISNTTRN